MLGCCLSPFRMSVGAESPFVDLSFAQACAEAAKADKLVFIDFYTTWCGPCKQLDKSTWKDRKVIAWLGDKTVALKVDADRHRALAKKYHVDSYPTLLFAKADGTEMDRMVGFVSAKEFLAEAEAIASGKDPLTRAREKLEAAGENNPMERMKYGRKLEDKGLHAEALEAYLWCFDHGLEHGIGFHGVRLSFLLSDLKRLGEKYPLAITAMRERRDAAKAAMDSGDAGMDRVMEFTSLNEYLGESAENMKLYDQLRREQPDSDLLPMLQRNLREELLAQRRYAEIAEGADLQAEIDHLFPNLMMRMVTGLFTARLPKEQREHMDEAMTEYRMTQAGEYYQILIGLKRYEEAEALAKRVLNVAESAHNYNELAWNGYLTGEPVAANLEQAKKAYDLSKGRQVNIVDTYARLLDKFGQREEGIRVAEATFQHRLSKQDRETLHQCLADLGVNFTARRSKIFAIMLAVLVSLVAAMYLLRRRHRAAAFHGASSAATPEAASKSAL